MGVDSNISTSTQPHGLPGRITRSASATEAAIATSVAAFLPQLSVPLMLGLPYTNSGLLTAACLFWVAVLWPRWEPLYCLHLQHTAHSPLALLARHASLSLALSVCGT